MPTVAVYPGSFDPITNGHLDVIHRAAAMFDKVIVAVARNGQKSPMFTVEERVALIRAAARKERNVQVDEFKGLLIQYARRERATASCAGCGPYRTSSSSSSWP
jgi:pantetheine-phosphate adenylyltransferase